MIQIDMDKPGSCSVCRFKDLARLDCLLNPESTEYLTLGEQYEHCPLIEAKEGRQTDAWHPVTETPPLWDDLMLKVHDKRCSCEHFNYYVMGFYDGREYLTYLFRHQDDHDIEIVGWMLCPWKGEEE